MKLADRVAVTARLAWPVPAYAAVAGFVMQAVLPAVQWWLPAGVAAGCALIALPLLALGPATPRDLPPRTQVERWGTPAQFGHAFLRAGLALAGLAVGAAAAAAAGL